MNGKMRQPFAQLKVLVKNGLEMVIGNLTISNQEIPKARRGL